MTRVLVTGCSGFVGRSFCEAAGSSGYSVRGALRVGASKLPGLTDQLVVGDIGGDTDWSAALEGIDLVVHLAAKAHVGVKSLAEDVFMECNARGTQRLVEAAVVAGVRRFIYVSSVKVNGEETHDRPFTSLDDPRPLDFYGVSKLRGEQAVLAAGATSRMQTVIVRPPLVYGPGVRANFLRLMSWVDSRRPLPLASIDNRRSLVSIWTLCDLLLTLLEHPAPMGTWMVSDGEDLSTPELIRRLGRAMNRPARLVAVPVGLLRLVGGALRKQAEISRLCGSLVVDAAETRRKLSWSPPLSVDEALSQTVSWYLSEGRARRV